MEGETAAGGGAGEGMGFPVHSPGPLPWCQVSEPAVDTGMYTNGQALSWIPNFSEEDFTSHRNVFVGIHVPYSAHRHHRKGRGRKHKHKDKAGNGDHTPPEQSIPALGEPPKTPMDPCDRVKFILGGEEEDGTANGTTPHQVFTELDELCMHHGRPVWKETARWLKFEEDVEEGGDKWSKPHVATLSLHSLFELRSNLMRGTVMLDVEANNLAHIADVVLDNLVVTGQLEEENREKVREALLIRHHHQNNDIDILRHIRSFADFRKDRSSTHQKKADSFDDSTSLQHELEVPHPTMGARSSSLVNNLGTRFPRLTASAKGSPSGSRQDVSPGEPAEEHHHHKHHANQRFLRKLPPGAEASNVLVGEVDFLTRPMIAFVRLSQAAWLGDITEVPIPTRFLFFLLGPLGNSARFHEVGRSISTLMADEVFRDVAYKARNREDLIAGVDEFLDKVTVLPPGEWDPNIRIEPPASIPSQAARKTAAVPSAGGSQQPSRRGSVQAGGGGGPPSQPNAGKKGEREEDKSRVPPLQREDDNGVQCTRRPFGGLIGDIKRRYPRYLTDYLDAFYPSAISPIIASIIFIYFASVAPAITFGALLGQKTNNLMGPMEMMLSCSLGNFVFSIFSGQPLIILGGTGPMLVFEDILFQFTETSSLPYLQLRFWIGMWVTLFLIVFVATDASYIIRLFTRFTEESFSVLISMIFIFEAFKSVWQIHVTTPYHPWLLYPTVPRECRCYSVSGGNYSNKTYHGNLIDLFGDSTTYPTCSEINPEYLSEGQCPEQYSHDVFFWSVILFFGTFLTIRLVKSIKDSPFLMTWLRKIIGDFAVLISVVLWMVANIVAKVNTRTLIIPNVIEEGFTPTVCSKAFSNGSDCNVRGWIVNPLRSGEGVELPVWGIFAAIVPALLAMVLIFMDQQITAVIVNRKDFKLKKGHGYHLDLLIVACLIAFFSILGLPWIVGATVRSLIHVQSLFKYSPFTAPGEVPRVEGVREQRVTSMVVAVLLGISIIAGPVLRFIPLPVLYGLFLFMGIASLSGVQFVDRFLLLFIPDKYKPDHEYVRHVPNRWIHAFTLTQVVCIVILAVVKETQASIVFPIAVVLILVLVRWVIGFIFPKKDLRYLDTALPKWMYRCPSPCCWIRKTKERERCIEMGNLMVYEEEPYQRPTTALSANSYGTAAVEGSAQTPNAAHQECSIPTINISCEVNRCNLYRHLDRMSSRSQPAACKKLLEGIAEAPESPVVKKPPPIVIDGNYNSSNNVQPHPPESLC